MNPGKYIIETREKLGMSQRDLSDASSVSDAEISKIESGDRKEPNPIILMKLAKALNIHYFDLYFVFGYIDKEECEFDLNLEVGLTGGSYIKQSRINKDLSQRKLGLLTKVSHSEISRLENEETMEPDVKTLKTVSEVLGIDYIKLLVLYGYLDKNVLNKTKLVKIEKYVEVKTNNLSVYSNEDLLKELLSREHK